MRIRKPKRSSHWPNLNTVAAVYRITVCSPARREHLRSTCFCNIKLVCAQCSSALLFQLFAVKCFPQLEYIGKPNHSNDL